MLVLFKISYLCLIKGSLLLKEETELFFTNNHGLRSKNGRSALNKFIYYEILESLKIKRELLEDFYENDTISIVENTGDVYFTIKKLDISYKISINYSKITSFYFSYLKEFLRHHSLLNDLKGMFRIFSIYRCINTTIDNNILNKDMCDLMHLVINHTQKTNIEYKLYKIVNNPPVKRSIVDVNIRDLLFTILLFSKDILNFIEDTVDNEDPYGILDICDGMNQEHSTKPAVIKKMLIEYYLNNYEKDSAYLKLRDGILKYSLNEDDIDVLDTELEVFNKVIVNMKSFSNDGGIFNYIRNQILVEICLCIMKLMQKVSINIVIINKSETKRKVIGEYEINDDFEYKGYRRSILKALEKESETSSLFSCFKKK